MEETVSLKKRKDKPIFLSLADLEKFVNSLNRVCFSVDETYIFYPRFRKDVKGSCYYFGLYISELLTPD